MNYASTIESNLLELVTAVVIAPLQAAYAVLLLLWTVLWAAVAILRLCAVPVACIGLLVAAWAICIACPMLPVGLAIVAAFAVATFPKAVR